MDDMNDSCHELKALDTMISLGLWLTWLTTSRKLKALDVMIISRLWLTWTTPGCDLRALDAMNNLGLLITTKKCYFVDLIIMVLSTFE